MGGDVGRPIVQVTGHVLLDSVCFMVKESGDGDVGGVRWKSENLKR